MRHRVASSPIGLIAAQAVHAGMGHHRTADRAADEAHGGGTLAGLVGVEFDVVVLGDAAALSFEPTDALPDLVDSFLGTRFR